MFQAPGPGNKSPSLQPQVRGAAPGQELSDGTALSDGAADARPALGSLARARRQVCSPLSGSAPASPLQVGPPLGQVTSLLWVFPSRSLPHTHARPSVGEAGSAVYSSLELQRGHRPSSQRLGASRPSPAAAVPPHGRSSRTKAQGFRFRP